MQLGSDKIEPNRGPYGLDLLVIQCDPRFRNDKLNKGNQLIITELNETIITPL